MAKRFDPESKEHRDLLPQDLKTLIKHAEDLEWMVDKLQDELKEAEARAGAAASGVETWKKVAEEATQKLLAMQLEASLQAYLTEASFSSTYVCDHYVENEKLKGKLLNRDARIEYLQNEVKAVCALRAQALARTDELLDELRVIHDTWSLPHMAKVKEEDFPYSAPAIEKILRKAGRIS